MPYLLNGQSINKNNKLDDFLLLDNNSNLNNKERRVQEGFSNQLESNGNYEHFSLNYTANGNLYNPQNRGNNINFPQPINWKNNYHSGLVNNNLLEPFATATDASKCDCTDPDNQGPTGHNTPGPTGHNTPGPTGHNTPGPTGNNTPTPSSPAAVNKFLDALTKINAGTMDNAMYPPGFSGTKQYKWVDLIKALKFVCISGISGNKFYVGNDINTGLVNLAAFLGQCMKETIQYNACDENNWSSDATYGWLADGGRKLSMNAGYSSAQGWDGSKPINYPITAACGQLGQSYEDYDCPDACPKFQKGTQLTGHTKASWSGAPGPMGETSNMASGAYNFPPQDKWDELSKNTNLASVNPQLSTTKQLYCVQKPKGTCWAAKGSIGTCGASAGAIGKNGEVLTKPGDCLKPLTPQQVTDAGGGWSWLTKLPKNVCVSKESVALKGGSNCGSHKSSSSCQSDTQCQWTQFKPKKDLSEGDCNWWGRGVIQTTGRCNFGKLNKAIGVDSKGSNTNNPYKSIDFCKNPEIICDPSGDQSLKWISGLFYWVSEVQSYSSSNVRNSHDAISWNFQTAIDKFMSTQGNDNNSFINAISGLVNRGCPSATACSSGAVDGALDRANNFKSILTAFKNAGVSVPVPK